MGDQIRWVPTDHMLVDSLTKSMNAALLMKYLQDYVYCFKSDDILSGTKHAAAKQRQEARAQKSYNPKENQSFVQNVDEDQQSDIANSSERPAGLVFRKEAVPPTVERFFVGFVNFRTHHEENSGE